MNRYDDSMLEEVDLLRKEQRENPAPTYVTQNMDKAYAAMRERAVLLASTPYPTMCITPEKCQGLTSCPRRLACSE